MALLLAAVAVAGCGKKGSADLANGKKLFAGKATCGSCHTLARANTKGTVGPNLDDAFATDRKDGLGDSSIEGLVLDQIDHPRRGSVMPAHLVTGENARDVAAYVGFAAGKAGKDTGFLATAAQPKAGPPAVAKGGTLTIAADPTGALAYVTNKASAPASSIKF